MSKLTARQFLKKFPESRANDNCLLDMGCPECGNRDNFHIDFTGTANVFDDGSDDEGDHEWEGRSPCRCDCGHTGTVLGFTFNGLDDLIVQEDDEK